MQHSTLKNAAENPPRELATCNFESAINPFLTFALTCSRIADEPRKLEKIRIVAEYLRGLQGEAVGIAATWFSGRPFPASQNKILHVGWAVLGEALRAVA